MKNIIPLAKPSLTKNELNSVRDVLNSCWLTQGPVTKKFEENFSKYCNVDHAVATSSGTTSLHLALRSIGIKPNDEILVPSLNFVAGPNMIVLQNAKPVFVDIDEKTFNIDPEEIENKISTKTKAIMIVDLYGNPADMDEIVDIAEKQNLLIIGDASHAHGAEYKKRKVGSISHLTCFSFHPMKNMTSGEGGMVTSNDKKIIEKIKILRNHGEKKSAWARSKDKKVRREFVEFGFNYKISDIHASIGIEQLKSLDKNNEKRIRNARYYTKKLKSVKGIITPTVKKYTKHVFHLYTIKVNPKRFEGNRDQLRKFLFDNKISTGIYYNPVHLEPIYRKTFGRINLKKTENICKQILSLPMYPDLSKKEIDYIVEKISEFKK